jgi:hypothetical protein
MPPTDPMTSRRSHPRDLLVHLRQWLVSHRETHTQHFGESDQSGHPHGYAGVVIPEWDVRQRLEEIDNSLTVPDQLERNAECEKGAHNLLNRALPFVSTYVDNVDGSAWTLEAEIKAFLDKRNTEWFDISTAPKDGTKILVYTVHDEIELSCWFESRMDQYEESGDGLYRKIDKLMHEGWNSNTPTHWQPLPSPPEEKKGRLGRWGE